MNLIIIGEKACKRLFYNPISPVIVKDEEVESLLPPDIEIPHLKMPSFLQLTFEALMCKCSLADDTGNN